MKEQFLSVFENMVCNVSKKRRKRSFFHIYRQMLFKKGKALKPKGGRSKLGTFADFLLKMKFIVCSQ